MALILVLINLMVFNFNLRNLLVVTIVILTKVEEDSDCYLCLLEVVLLVVIFHFMMEKEDAT